jgi:hypothetical protein
MNRSFLLVILLVGSQPMSAAEPAVREIAPGIRLTPGPTVSQTMIDAVTRADRALFTAVFDTCDIDALAGMVTDDMEFFHDKGGLTTTTGDAFVDAIRGKCARQQSGEDFMSRRELVEESVRVYPISNYGAIEVGEHRFFAIVDGQPDRLTETAKFTHVWKDDEGSWRIARVLSYDHVLVQ